MSRDRGIIVTKATAKHPLWRLHGLDGCLDCGDASHQPSDRGICRRCYDKRNKSGTLHERPRRELQGQRLMRNFKCPGLSLAREVGVTQTAEWTGMSADAIRAWKAAKHLGTDDAPGPTRDQQELARLRWDEVSEQRKLAEERGLVGRRTAPVFSEPAEAVQRVWAIRRGHTF